MKKLKEYRIRTFNAGWWFYILLGIILLLTLSIVLKGSSLVTKRMAVLILSILEYILLRAYKHALKDIRPNYNYYNELPCYLCNQSTILCILAALFNSRMLMSYCLSVGTIGALLALFMPDQYNVDQLFLSKQAVGFYGYHVLLIVTCLAFYSLDLYQPSMRDVLPSLLITFILATIAHAINLTLRKTGLNPEANYVYTIIPDNALLRILYRWIPIRLLYLVPVLIPFGIVSAILFLILQ